MAHDQRLFKTSLKPKRLAASALEELPRARMRREGPAGDETFELGTASAAIGLSYALGEQAVMLSAQVVVRIDVRWLALNRLAGGTQVHQRPPRRISAWRAAKNWVQKDVISNALRPRGAEHKWHAYTTRVVRFATSTVKDSFRFTQPQRNTG